MSAALSLVTLGVAFGIAFRIVNRSQERQFDEALLAVAEAESMDLSLHRGEEMAISERPGPAANDVGPLPLYGVRYGGDGRILYATANFHGAPPGADLTGHRDRAPLDFEWQGHRFRGVFVALTGDTSRLLIAASRSDLDGDAAFLTRTMIVVFGVAVAWTVVLVLGIATRITTTHRTIVATAQRVSAGDLSARIGSHGRSGEMAGLARSLDEMIERLALLLRGQQHFIAHAAHELRAPLATLYGELSLSLRRTRDPEEYRTAIEHALCSTRRLKQLAQDLLDLARLGEKAPVETEMATVRDVVADALEEAGSDAVQRGIAVSVVGDQAAIRGRRSDLVRMFRNLIENAVRHSPSGGAIDVRSSQADEDLIVEVSDEGTGVAIEDREQIFSPFFRRVGKGGGSNAGAGLGLTIARGIARLHGGELTLAAPIVGRGATFVVRLPRAIPAARIVA